MRDTTSVGEISESVIMSEFLKAGFSVLLPFGGSKRYDMVVEVGGSFMRVQCKTASPCGHNGARGTLRIATRSTSRSGEHTPYRDQVDLIAAYAPSTGQVYILPANEVPDTAVWLRVEPARRGNRFGSQGATDSAQVNQFGVRMAEDHTLDAWVARSR